MKRNIIPMGGGARKRCLAFCVFLFFIFLVIAGQEGRDDPVAKQVPREDIFAGHGRLIAEIHTDLDSLLKDIGEDAEYHPGIFVLHNPSSLPDTFQVRLKTRGNFRRKMENCSFPPLLLNFRKSELENTLLSGQDKLKLVTHCQTDDPAYIQHIIQEYLVYRMYSLLTPYSYRVRLLEISYRDTVGIHGRIDSYAFILEWDEDMAGRNGAELAEVPDLPAAMLDMDAMTLISMFQYLIDNNDWSVSLLHNIELLLLPGGRYVPVPFDFDWAGMVHAPYRISMLTLPAGKVSVPVRPFNGYCRTQKEMEAVAGVFHSRKNEIYELYRSNQLLNDESRGASLESLDHFYRIIKRGAGIRKAFLKDCWEQ